ncbi:MAG TPA: carbamoyltransferase [Leptospiraceae bacterium]|nr:carbamoyltransferase [Leptospiraceae bacterium]
MNLYITMPRILGISCFYHDAAASLVVDGQIVAAAQEERFTRKKHDPRFPISAIEYVLREGRIAQSDLDFVAFYDKPFIKLERILESILHASPRGYRLWLAAMPSWLDHKLLVARSIRRNLTGLRKDARIIFAEHHESHAAAAFYPSPFESAAFLTLDGVGEWTTTSWGEAVGNHLQIRQEIRFPHSLGMLYSAFTYYAGFKVNSGEYKLMGLAPYGEPRFVDTIRDHLIDVKDDGSFRLNMDYFDYAAGLRMTNAKFNELFDGPPRKPESPLTQREMDLARSVQLVTEECILKLGRHIHASTGMENLCLSGGVALNCVANGRLLREGPFKEIWVQPAAGDAGSSLGAALVAWHRVLGMSRDPVRARSMQKGSYLGPRFSRNEIKNVLDSRKAKYTSLPDTFAAARAAAAHIAAGRVVGWFVGRMEFGPRALGARSILGDPRNEQMQSVMNLKIKFRESFRPFAPSVLREDVSQYFDHEKDSDYMLMVAPVKQSIRTEMTPNEKALFGIEKLNVKRSEIPAVTHVDYSARIQTVSPENHPEYHALIAEFKRLTGCSVVINTSFNVRGEPIVMSPEQAYTCFMRTGMDVLVLENFLLRKEEQDATNDDSAWQKEFELD